jgi:hypothetical protein
MTSDDHRRKRTPGIFIVRGNAITSIVRLLILAHCRRGTDDRMMRRTSAQAEASLMPSLRN